MYDSEGTTPRERPRERLPTPTAAWGQTPTADCICRALLLLVLSRGALLNACVVGFCPRMFVP